MGNSLAVQGRANMIDRQTETWRPPAFGALDSPISRTVALIRRWVDLQASSIWRDLAGELPNVKGRVVDVGCGAQPYRNLFGPGVSYLGIDSADALKNFDYSVPDVRYYSGDDWPVEDTSVDFVLCTETLEHVLRPDQFLREAARSLVEGGRILITVPFAARWHYIPHDYWRFTPSSLKHVLTEAGFTDVRVYARGNAVTVAAYKMCAVILKLLMPQTQSRVSRIALMLAGLPLLPLFLLLTVVGNLSLLGRGGDDCIGYTATATRS